MKCQKNIQVWASELSGYLNGHLSGEDFLIDHGVEQIRSTGKFGNVGKLPSPCEDWLLISNELTTAIHQPKATILVTTTPDQAYIELVKEYFVVGRDALIHPTALISPSARIGKNVSVGAFSVIGEDVEIGAGCEIQNHVVLYGSSHIGSNVIIMDGAVIGNCSYEFFEDGDGVLLQPPPLGDVRIEDGVRIGAHTSIERSIGESTVIGRQAKIDDLVNLGGGSKIGSKALITAGCIIGRGVNIGEGCQLGMKASVHPGVSLAPGVIIGQATAVIHDISEPGIYVGVPAKKLAK